jgi:hypothetical protein
MIYVIFCNYCYTRDYNNAKRFAIRKYRKEKKSRTFCSAFKLKSEDEFFSYLIMYYSAKVLM